MNIEQASSISLVDFLAWHGHHPIRVAGQKLWYLSPYRNENTASFKVNTDINRWYDFGVGEGGGIILLAKRIYGTDDTSVILQRLQERTGIPVTRHSVMWHNKPPCHRPNVVEQGPVWEDVRSQPLCSYPLLDYLRRRGIPPHVGQKYCREISYRRGDRHYFAIGFLNDKGGYELRNPYFKGCMGRKAVTTYRSDNGKDDKRCCRVFEGFFDYLSYHTLVGLGALPADKYGTEDFIVLNSVANIGRVLRELDAYDRIYTYLDNDAAGRAATDTITGIYGDRVHDMAFVYRPHNDLNDFLCAITDGGKGKDNQLYGNRQPM